MSQCVDYGGYLRIVSEVFYAAYPRSVAELKFREVPEKTCYTGGSSR